MPIYIYGCENCGSEITISHSMTETVELCPVCESIGTLTRRPALFSNIKKISDKKEKVGSYVEEFIEDAKKELDQQKSDLRTKNDS